MDSIGLNGHTNSFSDDIVNGIDKPSGINGHKGPEIALDVPVLIVGGGPTGLLQAHLLSQLGGTFKCIMAFYPSFTYQNITQSDLL
jgi:hypothetical protein